MKKEHFICSECESEFFINYKEDLVEGLPSFCPWCAEYISEDEPEEPEEYEDDE